MVVSRAVRGLVRRRLKNLTTKPVQRAAMMVPSRVLTMAPSKKSRERMKRCQQ